MHGILLASGFELKVENGTLVLGDITGQNQSLLLNAHAGELKHDPIKGVGISDHLESYDFEDLARKIRQQFADDGMVAHRIDITNGIMTITANYK